MKADSSRRRRVIACFAALSLGTAGFGTYVWLASVVYRSQAHPETFRGWNGPRAWLLGPAAPALNEAAAAHLAKGLQALNDGARTPSDRLELYHEHLRAAEQLLVRSLRAQPAQARTLAQLAALRWEQDLPVGDEMAKYLDMIDVASAMAERVPAVQIQLADLLFKMGRRQDAERFIRRSLELDPGVAAEVVDLLRSNLYDAEEMLRAMPPGPEVLIALRPSFLEASELSPYLEALERALEDPTPSLLASYANTCLDTRIPERLERTLDGLGPFTHSRLEGERLLQRSRARVALGELRLAMEDAREARKLVTDDPRAAEQLGQVALGAGDAGAAVEAFRAALTLVARGTGEARWRARLYRQIGQAEERRGDPSRAYDAYRKALEVLPDEAYAKERVAQMRRAAGLGAPGSTGAGE